VRAGGPDPEQNRLLAQVLAEAQRKNVPKDIVKRNIDKASELKTDYKESIFEFYGFGGVSLLVNVVTDNDNRAAAEVNLSAKKQNLKAASAGSALFNFNRMARLDISKTIEEDALMEMCLEAGVDDYDLRTAVDGCPLNPTEEGRCVVFVAPGDMAAMRDYLRGKGFEVDTSVAAVPKAGFTSVSDTDLELNLAAIDAFEALDDVDSVEHNIDLTGDY
jgi:transcriptional/translational regulatory protein YebC/TACO1